MASKGELRKYTVCFTGHRELRHRDIADCLDTLLEELINQGYKFFGAGGALGFDMETAEAVLRARERHPIKLILVLPYPGQAERWSIEQRDRYESIKAKADKVKYISAKYAPNCFHVRNRALVDGAGLCVAYKYKDSGGTAYTVDYAKEQGLRVINIAEGGG